MRIPNPVGSFLLATGLVLVAVGTATVLAVRRPGRQRNPAGRRNSFVPEYAHVRWRGNVKGVTPVLMPGYETAAVDPRQEMDPDYDWESVFDQRVLDGLGACLEDPGCTTTDCAVVVMLQSIYPDAGSFALRPGTGLWKRQARQRAREVLADSLGHDEMTARANLCAVVGQEARAAGASLDDAALQAAEAAWPEVRWDADALGAAWQHEALARCREAIPA